MTDQDAIQRFEEKLDRILNYSIDTERGLAVLSGKFDAMNDRQNKLDGEIDECRKAIKGNHKPGLEKDVLLIQDELKRRDRISWAVAGIVLSGVFGIIFAILTNRIMVFFQ